MSDAHGIGSRMGLVSRTSWAQAFAAVTSFVPFLDEGLTAAFNRIMDDSLEGEGARLPSEQGNLVVGGTINHNMDYTNMIQYLEYCMGADSGTALTIVNALAKYGFLEFDKGVERHRIGAGKMTKFVLSGEKDGIIKCAADWYMYNFAASATAMATPAYTKGDVIYFNQMVFRIADQLNALVAGDAIGIESFEIAFDRAPKADDYESDPTNPQLPLEALENDFRACTLNFKCARFNDDNKHLVGWRGTDTPLQGDLTFTGGSNTMTVKFPQLRITEGFMAPIEGPGVITLNGTCEAYRNANAAHPMTGAVSNEMIIDYT